MPEKRKRQEKSHVALETRVLTRKRASKRSSGMATWKHPPADASFGALLTYFKDSLSQPHAPPGIKGLVKHMEAFQTMVAVEDIQTHVASQIRYLLTCPEGDSKRHCLNTVIYGPPGVGKSTLARHLGRLWSSCSCLAASRVDPLPEEFNDRPLVCVSRSQLVGRYCGWTAQLTKKALKRARGGVLFLDEAYALQTGPEDAFGTEALDQIVHFITSPAGCETSVIVAGYEQEMNERFFDKNPGLRSRFPWAFRLNAPSPRNMALLCQRTLKVDRLAFMEGAVDALCESIQKQSSLFSAYGRSCETFCFFLHLAAVNRTFPNPPTDISPADIAVAMRSFSATTVKTGLPAAVQSLYL